jgi:hypothetical protein
MSALESRLAAAISSNRIREHQPKDSARSHPGNESADKGEEGQKGTGKVFSINS